MARLADQLMTILGYEREFDVFGVPWGGALAQQFAFQYRRWCHKLVLAATSQGMLMVPGRLRWSALAAWAIRNVCPKLAPNFTAAQCESGQTPCRTCQSTTIAQGSRLPVPDVGRMGLDQPLVATLAAATLILAGTDDPLIPWVNARLMTLLIRNAQLHVVDDAHLFIATRAAEMAQLVRSFLTEDASALKHFAAAP